MKSKILTYRQWQALQAVVDAPNASHADRGVGRDEPLALVRMGLAQAGLLGLLVGL